MSKAIPIALAAHYASGATTTAHGLRITRTDGHVFGFTSADTSVPISGVLYDATQGLDISSIVTSAGLAVDNLELTTLDDGTLFQRVDVLSGVWQNARFLIFKYNFKSPADGIEQLMAGITGQVKLQAGAIVVELRGLQQYLQQAVGNVTSRTCRARFADFPQPNNNNKCRLSSAAWTDALIVSEVTNGRVFKAASDEAGAAGDDYFTFVSLLLHGNGADGSTTLVDNSPSPLTVSIVGGVAISTASPQFGSGAILFNGSSGYIVLSSGSVPAAFDFTASDFCIELWVKRSSATTCVLFTSRNDGVGTAGLLWYINSSGGLVVVIGSTSFAAPTGAVPVGSWSYIKINRNGSTWTQNIDGTIVHTFTQGNFSNPTAYDVRIGVSNGGGFFFDGLMDDLRITKHSRVITAVPTAEFKNLQTILPPPPRGSGWFDVGVITWAAGGNIGLKAKVKKYSGTGVFELSADAPYAIQVGDTLQAIAGCHGRLQEDCRDRFNNVINFQGEPHMPGIDVMTRPTEPSA